VSAIMLIHAIFTALEPVVKAATFAFGALLVSLGLAKSPTPIPLSQQGGQGSASKEIEDKEQGVTNLGELPSTEEAVAFLWQKLAAHVKSEGSFPATLFQALINAAAEDEKRGPRDEFVIDESEFDEGLALLGLKGVTAQIAGALLLQATHTSSGKLMTVAELLDVLNEPKYSSDGKLSRLERASRSLSIDGGVLPVELDPPRTSQTPAGTRKSKSQSSKGSKRNDRSPMHARMLPRCSSKEIGASSSTRAATPSRGTDLSLSEMAEGRNSRWTTDTIDFAVSKEVTSQSSSQFTSSKDSSRLSSAATTPAKLRQKPRPYRKEQTLEAEMV